MVSVTMSIGELSGGDEALDCLLRIINASRQLEGLHPRDEGYMRGREGVAHLCLLKIMDLVELVLEHPGELPLILIRPVARHSPRLQKKVRRAQLVVVCH